ncbi:MAG: dienelactone hydrolase family protein [Burkholderiaceae bacterium]
MTQADLSTVFTTPAAAAEPVTQLWIDQQVYDLYDEYCHGDYDRREFLRRAAKLSVVGGSALVMAQALLPRYAQAQQIMFTDKRIKAQYVSYDSPGGTSGKMRGYLVQPEGEGPFPCVLVIHENRGLNPYIEDVARRAAVAGFLALAPDGLSPIGGYPGNDDDGKTMQRSLDQSKLRTDMLNSANFLKAHQLSSGKLGATGFCWGGGTANYLAATMGDELSAAAPYYGAAAQTSAVPNIKAALLVHMAEKDDRINAMWPAYETALKAAGTRYEQHTYPQTQHGFHNDSTPRYNEAQAKISWERTVAFFRKELA